MDYRIRCNARISCFLVRLFPLEWTKSNPTFLLSLLDAFQIEGRQEIKDLFFKVCVLETYSKIEKTQEQLFDFVLDRTGKPAPYISCAHIKRVLGARHS